MNMRLCLLVTVALASAPAAGFEDEMEAEESVAQSERPVHLRADLLLRGDHVSGLPGGREDLERIRGRLELGLESASMTGFRYGLAGQLMAGSDRNRDNLRNNDNEKSDAAQLTEAWLGYRWESVELVAGKTRSAVNLTPLLWDADLRPTGVSARTSVASGDFNRWEFVISAAEVDHPLASGSARATAFQTAWHWQEGGANSASLRLGFIDFTQLEGLAQAGLGRGNTLVAGRYLHGYQLLDLQAELRWRVAGRPLVASINGVRNLDAPTQRDGGRFSLVLGDAGVARGWELGYAIQRFQRDSVLAAVTSDDWWFHTAARGYMPWIGFGFNSRWALRLAGFRESRDGLDESTTRLLLDLTARW